MTQLSYTVPSPGNNFSTEAPKVDTALTQILNTVNGNLDSSNLNMSAVGAALGAYLPGALLASQWYSPNTAQNYSAAANTWTYPDSTNLAVTAVVPNSGNVIIRAHGGMLQANGVGYANAGVNTSASGYPITAQMVGATNSGTNVGTAAAGGSLIDLPFHLEAKLTGLGSGSTTFYLAMYFQGTNGNLYVEGDNSLNGGPMLITVTGA